MDAHDQAQVLAGALARIASMVMAKDTDERRAIHKLAMDALNKAVQPSESPSERQK